METAADRLRRARLSKGYQHASDAAQAFGWNVNTYSSNENGNAPFSFKKAGQYAKAFGVRPEWLYTGQGEPAADASVPIIGYVGADTEGTVLYADGQDSGDRVPVPPGGSARARALEIRGHSMRGIADHGGLIYFEEQHTRPTHDMLGEVVVVGLSDNRVLVKRLLKGSKKGLFDLESVNGPTIEDAPIAWVAMVTAIIPPPYARRIIMRSGASDAA